MQITIETEDIPTVANIIHLIRSTPSVTLIESKGFVVAEDPIYAKPHDGDAAFFAKVPTLEEKPALNGHSPEYRRRQGVYVGLIRHATKAVQREARIVYHTKGVDAAIRFLADTAPKPKQQAKRKKKARTKARGHRSTCAYCGKGFIAHGRQRYCCKKHCDRANYVKARDRKE